MVFPYRAFRRRADQLDRPCSGPGGSILRGVEQGAMLGQAFGCELILIKPPFGAGLMGRITYSMGLVRDVIHLLQTSSHATFSETALNPPLLLTLMESLRKSMDLPSLVIGGRGRVEEKLDDERGLKALNITKKKFWYANKILSIILPKKNIFSINLKKKLHNPYTSPYEKIEFFGKCSYTEAYDL